MNAAISPCLQKLIRSDAPSSSLSTPPGSPHAPHGLPYGHLTALCQRRRDRMGHGSKPYGGPWWGYKGVCVYIYMLYFSLCFLYIIDIIWYNHQIRINSASKNNHSLIIKWTSNHRHDHVGLGLQTSHSKTWANKDRISKHIWTIPPGESDQKRWYDTVMRHMRHMCRGQKHPTIPNKMVDEDPEPTPFIWQSNSNA